jgi:hypothetical protein
LLRSIDHKTVFIIHNVERKSYSLAALGGAFKESQLSEASFLIAAIIYIIPAIASAYMTISVLIKDFVQFHQQWLVQQQN